MNEERTKLDRLFDHGNDNAAWRNLIMLETVMLLLLIALLVIVLCVSVYYDRERIFTNTGIIVVFGAILGEVVRRFRHLREDRQR